MKKIMVGIALVSFLYAGGWDHPVQGIRGLGMGDAYTALAEDATAIWWNPAGLSFQKNMLEVNVGGTVDMPMHTWKFPDPADPSAEKEATSNLVQFIPQAFISYKLNKFGLGFGYYVAYGGGGVDWKEEDVGSDIYSVLGVMSFTPTFSYMINEKFGIGARINILYGAYKNETIISQPVAYSSKKDEGSGWAFSGGAGILYKPLDILSVGFNFRGPFTLKPSGTHEEDTLKFDTESEVDFPMAFAIGFGLTPMPNVTLGLDFEYTTWSTLDYFITTIKKPMGESVDTMDFLFEDIFKIKFGGEYAFPEIGLALRTGFAYDKAASPDSTLSPGNIDPDKFVIFGGIGYEKANFGIDISVLKAFGSERKYEEEVAPGVTVTNKYNMNPIAIGVALKYRL